MLASLLVALAAACTGISAAPVDPRQGPASQTNIFRWAHAGDTGAGRLSVRFTVPAGGQVTIPNGAPVFACVPVRPAPWTPHPAAQLTPA